MAGIVFDLSPSDAKQKFCEYAEAVLDTHEIISEKLLQKLEEKARGLELHKLDYHAILVKVVHERGGLGMTLAFTDEGQSALSCVHCNVVTPEVNWFCSACRNIMQGQPQSFTCNITGIEFVFVSGGMFQMGDIYIEDENGTGAELPVHSVSLNSFYISKTPVTYLQYELFLKENNRYHPQIAKVKTLHYLSVIGDESECILNDDAKNTLADNYLRPITHVTWNDATAFAYWLSVKCGKNVRLPTEAEWEYAARSKGNNDKWSGTRDFEKIDNYVWHFGNTERFPMPVAKLSQNALGLYDMSGNVWEWCQDWYDRYYYESSPEFNPTGPDQGCFRVLRGGSWNEGWRGTRVSARDFAQPDICTETIGFRVVCR